MFIYYLAAAASYIILRVDSVILNGVHIVNNIRSRLLIYSVLTKRVLDLVALLMICFSNLVLI